MTGRFASLTFAGLVVLGLEPFDIFGPHMTLRAGMKLALSAWAAALHGRRAWKRRQARRLAEKFAKKWQLPPP